MANTYTQLYVHIVFATSGRRAVLPDACLDELFRYAAGILARRGHKVLAIGGMPDHMHVAVGMLPTVAIADLVRDLKAGTSGFINQRQWVAGRFEWQRGYGAFSCSRSQLDTLCRYIANQKRHHRHRTLRDEYLELLDELEIEYDSRYVLGNPGD
jgi:putative transposase